MKTKILEIVLWLLIGLIVLIQKDVSKLSYGLCWGCLMINLIGRAVE